MGLTNPLFLYRVRHLKMKGFAPPLTKPELDILLSFSPSSTLVWPVDLKLSISETRAALDSLKKKQLITGSRPYKLTKLGQRLKHEHQTSIFN